MKSNWEKMKLGELCDLEIGKTPYRKNLKYWDKKKQTNNIWLSIADMKDAENKTVYDSKEYISDQGASLCKIVTKGTLLISFKLTLGRLAFAGNDLYTNEAIAALNNLKEDIISKEYLYYYFKHFDWDAATKGDIKVKGKTLNKTKLNQLDVFFPKEIEQQKQIVRQLDDFFRKLRSLEDNYNKQFVLLAKIKESKLASLFEYSQ